MNALSARDGYRLWAPTYGSETAISHLEQKLVTEMTPPLTGLRLLDAGCGTGRRLRGTGAARAVGVELCQEMLDAGLREMGRDPAIETMVGDVRALPLPDRSFDMVWCRLVIGHLPDCAPAYAELGRVADAGALVIVTDFHPAAWAAGHRRTFRYHGRVEEIEHHVHELLDHIAAAKAAGLTLVAVREAAIGADVYDFYDKAGRFVRYAADYGLPAVLALAFRREG
jgi:malonyl-CoA O-methyltransferase